MIQPISLTPASYGARIAAALIDLVIVTAGASVLSWPLLKFLKFDERLLQIQRIGEDFAKNPDAVQIDPEIWQSMTIFLIGLLIVMLVLLLATHAYYIYSESSASGQTLGKKALGLRVVDLEGHQITRTQAVYREVLRWYVDGLFIFPAFIAMGKSPKRQRVGDLVAKTMVVNVAPSKI
jgi:uncharacterized RDD family membrane protein YckC